MQKEKFCIVFHVCEKGMRGRKGSFVGCMNAMLEFPIFYVEAM